MKKEEINNKILKGYPQRIRRKNELYVMNFLKWEEIWKHLDHKAVKNLIGKRVFAKVK